MRFILTIYLLTFTFYSNGQNVIRIIDEKQSPVEFCLLEIDSIFFYTNEFGELDLNSGAYKTIKIHSIGFKDTIVKFHDSKLQIIQLETEFYHLPEVVISNNNGQNYFSTFGKNDSYSSLSVFEGFQIAYFFNDPNFSYKKIDKIRFHLKNKNKKNNQVRLLLYNVEDNKPNKIIQSSIIEDYKYNRHYLEFDLSSANINVPIEGLFVAIEILSDDPNINRKVLVYPKIITVKNCKEKEMYVKYLGKEWKLFEMKDAFTNTYYKPKIEIYFGT